MSATQTQDAPYLGLRPFDEPDAHLFFGRDQQIDDLIDKVASCRLVTVIGPSGCGKSSLVKAGLIPALREIGDWRVTKIRPGNDPIGNLAEGLAETFHFETDRRLGFELTMVQGRLGLVESVAQSKLGSGERLLIVVDQFEEIFRNRSKSAPDFIKLLLEATAQAEIPIYTILTMRSDYLGNCSQFRDLPERINRGLYLVPRLRRDQLREVIAGPLDKVGASMTPRLIQALLNDVGDDPDQLPVIQHALRRIWTRAGGKEMDLSIHYRQGELNETLDKHADEIYDHLLPEQQLLVEPIFRSLCEVDESREIRRPADLHDLAEVCQAPVEEVSKVVERFAGREVSFLTEGPPVDITHESLIRQWRKLKSWAKTESADRDEYIEFERRSSRSGPDGPWLTGTDLDRAKKWLGKNLPAKWAERYGGDYQRTRGYIAESLKRHLQAEEAERAERDAARRRAYKLAGVAFIVALGLGLLASYALRQQSLAEKQRLVGIWQSIARDSLKDAPDHVDDDRSLLLARQAFLLYLKTPDASWSVVEDSLQRAVQLTPISHVARGHESDVLSVAFAPDGTRVASGSDDNTIRVWDLRHPQSEPLILRGHDDTVHAVAFAPDGTRVVSGGDDKTIRIWDLRQPQSEPVILRGHEGTVNSLAFAPSGDRLASGGNDGTIRIWDLRQQNDRIILHARGRHFLSVAFAPDGTRLASASAADSSFDNAIEIWDLARPESEPVTIFRHESYIRSVAFAPVGARLASGSDDNTIQIWNLAQLQQNPVILRGHEAAVHSVAFSPDGTRLASGSDDNTIRIWNLAQRQERPAILRGHERAVSSVAFAEDGRRLASGSQDGMVRVWDLSQQESSPATLRGHGGNIRSLSFAPDGTHLAASGDSTTIWISDVNRPQSEPVILRGHQGIVRSVVYAPDGKHLASGADDGTVRIWDVIKPESSPVILHDHEGFVSSVAFAPDGSRLASAGLDKIIRVWDLRQPQSKPVISFDHGGIVSSVAFAPDGTRLASAGYDKIVRVWDLRRPQSSPLVLRGHQFHVSSVAFAPDGNRLASGSFDNTIRIWDLGQPQNSPLVLRGPASSVMSVAFSPDGNRLASGSNDGTIGIWDFRHLVERPVILRGFPYTVYSVAFAPDGTRLSSGGFADPIYVWDLWSRAAERICEKVWRNLTMEEWRLYIGEGIPYERTCLNLPPGIGAPGAK
jgi:WD40 repeat protein/energy-coupling factor transporter ATP-binding protein EcfA2